MVDSKLAPYGAFVLRLAIGVMFVAHGLLKLVVFTPAGTVGFFESIGLPGVFAYLTILAEVGGGLLILAGVLSRVVNLALIPVLLGALFLVHWQAGWLFSNAGGGWEYPAFLAIASLASALIGPGAFTLPLPQPLVRLVKA